VSGKVFCFDPVAALQKGYYYVWPVDGKTKFLPKFGWPVIIDGNGDYEITFKAKFKNGTNVEGNLALGMVAAKPDGTLKDGKPTTTTYSKPDPNGWVTVTLKYALSDVQTASFSIATPQTVTDTLHLAELYAAKCK